MKQKQQKVTVYCVNYQSREYTSSAKSYSYASIQNKLCTWHVLISTSDGLLHWIVCHIVYYIELH